MNSEIKQYEVWLANLNPRFGTGAGKKRPVVIIQTNLLNAAAHPSTLICPVSTNVIKEATILRVHLAEKEGGLEKASDNLIDQIRAIDNQRLVKKLGVLSVSSKNKLIKSLKIIFDLLD